MHYDCISMGGNTRFVCSSRSHTGARGGNIETEEMTEDICKGIENEKKKLLCRDIHRNLGCLSFL